MTNTNAFLLYELYTLLENELTYRNILKQIESTLVEEQQCQTYKEINDHSLSAEQYLQACYESFIGDLNAAHVLKLDPDDPKSLAAKRAKMWAGSVPDWSFYKPETAGLSQFLH